MLCSLYLQYEWCIRGFGTDGVFKPGVQFGRSARATKCDFE